MQRQELKSLNRLANTLVKGFPIIASVRYDPRAARLTVACRSKRAPTQKPSELRREWSPSDADLDLDRYVRDHVGEFLRLWIREE